MFRFLTARHKMQISMIDMMQRAISILDLFVNGCIIGTDNGPENIFAAVPTKLFIYFFDNTQKLFQAIVHKYSERLGVSVGVKMYTRIFNLNVSSSV